MGSMEIRDPKREEQFEQFEQFETNFAKFNPPKTSAKRQHLARGPSAPPVVEVGLVWPFSAVPGPI